MSTSILDEAYVRLHRSGPERVGGWLSNHAPMAVEALARHGHADAVQHWIDAYEPLLDEAPRGLHPVTAENWREALGDPRRLGDWPVWFRGELATRPWQEVLAVWWPRLLPGIAAGATHGVIRTGHAVRTLREDGPSAPHVEELAQALGYWAARWQQLPGTPHPADPAHPTSARAALALVPRIPDQTGGIADRLAQLADLAEWSIVLPPQTDPDLAFEQLKEVVTAATLRYLTFGHGNPTMLVHTATAPNAVLRTLPSLPREQWAGSVAAAWAAATAVTAAYAPAEAAKIAAPATTTPDEAFAAAVEHGNEHVLKFADTALDVYAWTADERALYAAIRGRDLHSRD